MPVNCGKSPGNPPGIPGGLRKIGGPVPEPYRTEVVPYRSRTVRDSHGIPRDPLQPPLPKVEHAFFNQLRVRYAAHFM